MKYVVFRNKIFITNSQKVVYTSKWNFWNEFFTTNFLKYILYIPKWDFFFLSFCSILLLLCSNDSIATTTVIAAVQSTVRKNQMGQISYFTKL